LRDQSFWLDAITTVATFALLLVGPLLGGRWNWQRGLPGLACGALCDHSQRHQRQRLCRRAPAAPAMMLLLGLQDWSGAPARRAKAIALAGLALLGLRTVVTPPALPTMPTISASSCRRSNISSRAAAC
jgi:hypothetical protein